MVERAIILTILILVTVFFIMNSGEVGVPFISQKPEFFWSGGTRDVETDSQYISDLGIKNAETNALWKTIETTKGKYDFEELDSTISGLKNSGITNICITIYPTNEIYNIKSGLVETQEQFNAYENFLDKLTTRYPKVDCYQIVKEMNLEKFSGTPEQYAELLVFSHDKITEVNSNAIIVFGAQGYDFRETIGRT